MWESSTAWHAWTNLGVPLLDSQQKPWWLCPGGLCRGPPASAVHGRDRCRGGIPGQGTSPPPPCRTLTFHSARTSRANSRSPPSVLPTMIQMGICQSSCLEISKVICRAGQAEALLGTREQPGAGAICAARARSGPTLASIPSSFFVLHLPNFKAGSDSVLSSSFHISFPLPETSDLELSECLSAFCSRP